MLVLPLASENESQGDLCIMLTFWIFWGCERGNKKIYEQLQYSDHKNLGSWEHLKFKGKERQAGAGSAHLWHNSIPILGGWGGFNSISNMGV